MIEDTADSDRASDGVTPGRVYNVLFLCTGNSARSIMAEALLNYWGGGRFRAWSAGSFPTGRVNPRALELLAHAKIPAAGARSKSWDEFTVPGGVQFDYVITVCDDAAGEACPAWPGLPMTAHWGVPDPAAADGTDAQKALAFREAFRVLEHRIRAFLNLPFESPDREALQRELAGIGRSQPGGAGD
jgi:arsenate reductase